MKGFLDLPYRLPFALYYKEFDAGFYVDFPKQLRMMGQWLQENGCRKTLDIGAMTGGCIEYISGLGIRMDGVQFTRDVKRLAEINLRKAGVVSTLFVSPVYAHLKLPAKARYDGIVSLGWFNLPHATKFMRKYLDRIHSLLTPGGVFMFDFFEFKNLIVPAPEVVRLGRDIVYESVARRVGKVLRRSYTWTVNGRKPLLETSDLVDRTADEVRRMMRDAGLAIVKEEFLEFNYPREFWLARKP